ncbi:hypothetical protein ACPA9J_21340 [Pseudomonas aeruginosa]
MVRDAERGRRGGLQVRTGCRSQPGRADCDARKMITEAGDKATAEDKATIEGAGRAGSGGEGRQQGRVEAKMNTLSRLPPLAQKMYRTGPAGRGAPQAAGESR